MSSPVDHASITIPVQSRDELSRQFKELQGWLFRGHRDAAWPIEPTVVRCARRNGATSTQDIGCFEQRCFKEFTRRATNHIPFRPHNDSTAEWLGWMQHYGAPTRLIDITTSPWVATFFAIEELDPPKKPHEENLAAVWAIEPQLVQKRDPNSNRNPDRNLLLGFLVDPDRFRLNRHIDPYDPTFDQPRVEEMLPHLVPDRIQKQKGKFLFAFDLKDPVCNKLVALADKESTGRPATLFRKITIPSSLRRQLLAELAQMNIDAVTLFPSPDGKPNLDAAGRQLRSEV